MDIVYIRGLKIQAIIGIFEWERENRQTVILDIEMAMDSNRTRGSEDINDALDYKKVTDRVAAFVSDSSFQLVETLADNIAEIIQGEFGVSWLRLSVGKPQALDNVECVGVTIERGLRETGVSF